MTRKKATPAPAPAAIPQSHANMDDVMALLGGLMQRVDALQAETGQARVYTPPPLSPDIIAAIEAQAQDVQAAHDALNEIVTFQVDQLFVFDGDPDSPGQEHYAHQDWDRDAHCDANGVADVLDEAGDPIIISGDRFLCPRVTAMGLVKARVGRIVPV
jgi:hypothetical protein